MISEIIMKKYLLAINQGTTSSSAIIFDDKAKLIASEQIELNIITENSGWVEQNAEEIWETVNAVIKKVIIESKIKTCEIAGIGITNQRETTILWDKNTGKPLYRSIVWQSRQSDKI